VVYGNDHFMQGAYDHFGYRQTSGTVKMRRPRATLVPALTVDRRSSTPIYRQLYEGFRAAIIDGRLRPGQTVPSTRSLALELSISRIPAINAYEQLRTEGYLAAAVGAGTRVAEAIFDDSVSPSTAVRSRRPSRGTKAPTPRALSRRAKELLRIGVPQPWLPRQGAFRMNLPALDQFPGDVWGKLVSRHSRAMRSSIMAYGDAMGYLPLRQAIADYLGTVRAVRCDPAQIAITTGSQQGLQLSAQLLLDESEEICVEEPGYPGARLAFAAAGGRVTPVPVDEEGLSVEELARRAPRARAVYITPSHQYPLGMVMSAGRRMRLLNWAATSGTWIIEDDYDSEYRFGSYPIGSLQGMDGDSRVIYLGTFSKVMFPALRLGYVVVPRDLVAAFGAVLDAAGIFSSPLYQTVLTEFIQEGHLARHIRRMRILYMERRKTLVAALRAQFGDTLDILGADAGMHVVALLPPGVDDVAMSRSAASQGIAALPLSTCYVSPPVQGGVVLGYGGATLYQLRDGVRRLKASLPKVNRG
jgi:GntR family transcriptional regulator / MocR family aminotransferase